MTRSELIAELEKHSIPSSAYCFDGPGGGECYSLEADRGGWIIYYNERGRQNVVARYPTEEQANEAFLTQLKAVC